MSRKCELTGKSPLKGHTVSHSNNKVKRKFNPNIKKVSFSSKVLNRKFKLNVSSAGLRTIDYKGGIDKFCLGVNLSNTALLACIIKVFIPADLINEINFFKNS